MNIHDDRGHRDPDDTFDRAMRELHAHALTQVSPRTRARLRAARTAATRRAPTRGLRWGVATGVVAGFALAIGLQWHGPSSNADAPTQTATRNAEDYGAVATLEESPDLYLWLASNDDTLPANWER